MAAGAPSLCLWGSSSRVAGGPGLGAEALCRAPELGKEVPGAVCFVFSSVVKTSSHHFILLFYQQQVPPVGAKCLEFEIVHVSIEI